MSDFDQMVERATGDFLHGSSIDVFQVNVGLRCNQECVHCHLGCSPAREELMSRPTMELVIEAAEKVRPGLVDITGGAPELNPDLRRFIQALRERDFPVQVRTNLTVLLEECMGDMPAFYRNQGVSLVASMPCYLEENVRAQRGEGVYEKSIECIRRLNSLGYGIQPELPRHDSSCRAR
jgi:radical SAM/Cys-rich protein